MNLAIRHRLREKGLRLLRKSKIGNRLIVSFILLTLLPLGIISVYAFHKSNEAIQSKTTDYSGEILQLVKQKISAETKIYENFADEISLNAKVQNGLVHFGEMNDLDKMTLGQEINRLVSEKFPLLQNVKDIQIHVRSGQSLYELGYDSIRPSDAIRLAKEAAEKNRVDLWQYASTVQGMPCVVLVRQIHTLENVTGPVGYMLIAINESMFSANTYANVSFGEGSDLFILNDRGIVVSSYNPRLARGERYPEAASIAQVRKRDSERIETARIELNKRPYLAIGIYEPNEDWHMVATIPFAYLTSESRDIRRGIYGIGTGCVAIAILCAVLISRSISVPLGRLVSTANQVSTGNLAVKIADPGHDEIGLLGTRFDKMIGQINELIEDVKREQRMKRETELKMLQAQINPHFLFNTLNSLKWVAVLSQVPNLSKGLGALSELLRHTIVDTNELIPIREEIRNLKNYAFIQKIRYGSAFSLFIDIDEEALACRIPKFLLQPIIENSILHGLEGIDHEEKITVCGTVREGTVTIVIADNGRGMPAEVADKLLSEDAGLSEKRFSNMGIRNVHERIRLYFGESYGIRVHSKPNEGTEATILIPLLTEHGGEPR